MATSTDRRPALRFQLDRTPPEGWDRFALSSGCYFFSTVRWTEAVAAGFGGEVLFATLMDGDEIVVAMIGTERKTIGFRMLQSFFPYGGLIGDVSRGDELLDHLLPALKERRYHSLVVEDPFCGLPEGHVAHPTYGRRHVRPMERYELPVDEAEMFRTYHKSVKKNVRRAREAGLVVTEATSESDVGDIYEMYRSAMERNHAPTWYPKDLFVELMHRFVPTGEVRYLVVKHDGHMIGMMAMLYSEHGGHYWMGGSSEEGLKLRVNDLLFHHAICLSAERGDRFLDLMGTGVEDASLARFKEKWGGVSEEVLGYHLDLVPFRAKLLRVAYRLVRQGPGAWLVRKIIR
ncbi:MAG: GNAT family N-acetyltransferase [Actinobacteria bacterium]|nr:GNAT family N-acetyltransferase [Actinomycetota bacterium]